MSSHVLAPLCWLKSLLKRISGDQVTASKTKADTPLSLLDGASKAPRNGKSRAF